ncbi:MAG TPA: DNA gyrase C-terminal beta-propeller domain-containing protein, partial [Lacunisphaera sp.]|nr:DNA gyrase C-terminal beta-propeller domain-containing protein [Lacunisphaera sp.]
QIIINQLYQKTALESSFGVILLALDQKRPKQMNIKELLECYIDHRRDAVTRRTQFRLRQAEARAHILEGYIIALDNLDDFVKIIRASKDRDDAKAKLMAKYPLTEIQTNAILELRLYQLTGLERGKIEAEYMELEKLILELREILASEAKLLALIKKELLELKDKYASPRRTEIVDDAGELRMEDVIPNEGCVITVSHLGFIKRTPVAAYRAQKRGGKGVIGAETYEEDFVETLFTASTHDYVLFLTSTGQCLAKKIYDIPEGTRTAKGKSVSSFLRLNAGEKLAAMLCFKEFAADQYVVMATRAGAIKKTSLLEYEGATREGGIRGMKLTEGDIIIGCVLTNGANEVILVSHLGQAVRFFEGAASAGAEEGAENGEAAAPAEGETEGEGPKLGLRPQGRFTGGVTGMRFKKKGDFLQAIEVCDPEARLLVAREDGIGKRTPFEDYRLIRRGGTGVIAIDLPEDGSVAVAGALSVRDADEVMLLTAKGQSIRTRVKEIRETGRGAKGVRLVNLEEGDKLLAIARVVESDEEEAANSNPPIETPPSP